MDAKEAKEISEKQRNKIKSEREAIIHTFVEKCDKEIKNACNKGETYCYYHYPDEDTGNSLEKIYKDRGFRVDTYSSSLYISWG